MVRLSILAFSASASWTIYFSALLRMDSSAHLVRFPPLASLRFCSIDGHGDSKSAPQHGVLRSRTSYQTYRILALSRALSAVPHNPRSPWIGFHSPGRAPLETKDASGHSHTSHGWIWERHAFEDFSGALSRICPGHGGSRCSIPLGHGACQLQFNFFHRLSKRFDG